MALKISIALLGILLVATAAFAQSSGTSPLVSYTCTGSPCPWGQPQEYHLEWPEYGVNQRLGYTLSHDIYLPAANAVSVTIEITAGSATLYAVEALTSTNDYEITTLTTGQAYTITESDVVAPEHIQLHSFFPFSYIIYPVEPEPPLLPTATSTAIPSVFFNTTDIMSVTQLLANKQTTAWAQDDDETGMFFLSLASLIIGTAVFYFIKVAITWHRG